MRRHTEQSIRWTNARNAAKAGDLRTQRAIRRHQQLRDWASWRQLQRIGDHRENAKIIERETKIIQRLILGRVRRLVERSL